MKNLLATKWDGIECWTVYVVREHNGFTHSLADAELNHSNCLLDRKFLVYSYFDKMCVLSNANTQVWLSWFPIFQSVDVGRNRLHNVSLTPLFRIETAIPEKTMSNWQNRQVDLWHILCTCSTCSLDSSPHTTHTYTHSLTWHRFHPVEERQYTHPIHPSMRVCTPHYMAQTLEEWWSCLPMAMCSYMYSQLPIHLYVIPFRCRCRRSRCRCQRFFFSRNIYFVHRIQLWKFYQRAELSSSIPIRPSRWAFTFDIYGLIQVHAVSYPALSKK